MKKLSIRSNNTPNKYKLSSSVEAYLYKDGFSGFLSTNGVIQGTCCACSNHLCSQYTEEELKSERFAAFPKNPSNRVCPTNSIKISSEGKATINSQSCIRCGLCLYRCPYAAIQLSLLDNTCIVNEEIGEEYTQVSEDKQIKEIEVLQTLPRKIQFSSIPALFANMYSTNLTRAPHRYPDVSEIIVRNTFLNLGIRCNVNAQGNVHMRVEFFAELLDYIIIGESEITNLDTLSVIRRILDDTAVMVNRQGYDKNKVIQLAVINGLPNRRTDYYEVIEDIHEVLGMQVCTITYHILFVLNLFRIKLTEDSLLQFVVNKNTADLSIPMQALLENISEIDHTLDSSAYKAIK